MTETFSNNAISFLVGSIGSGDLSYVINDASLFPSTGNFRVRVDQEIMLVGARTGNALSSITRGIEGTTAVGHSPGATVSHVLTAGALSAFSQTGGGGGGGYPQSALVMFVSSIIGNNANDGLSPSTPKATIQAAYNALKTYANANFTQSNAAGMGVGRIQLLPGDHDVGTGVVIDQNRTVEIEGALSGWRGLTVSNTASRVISNSSSATALITLGSQSAVTYGNVIRKICFVVNPAVNTSLTACVRAQAHDYFEMTDCAGYTTDGTNRDIPLLEQNPGGSAQDNAWCRFLQNSTTGLPLYYAKSGTNFNRSLIGWNVCQFGSGATYPMIWLEGDWVNGLVVSNNLEGGASGPHVRVGSASHGADFNVFLENAGEASTNTYPFYDVIHGGHNRFIGGSCTASGIGVWIAFSGANSFQNEVFGPYDYTGFTNFKRQITDVSTYPASNILHGRNGRIMYTKQNANPPAFSGSDFVSTPADGSIIGMTRNTNTGEARVWFVLGGAFHYVLGESSVPIVVNVKGFGAIGDGTTNDSTAVQNAINSLPSAGGTLYFPAGKYLLNAGLTVLPGIKFVGAGSHVGYIAGQGAALLAGADNIVLVSLDRTGNLTQGGLVFEDMVFSGNGHVGVTGIYTKGVNRVQIRNVGFEALFKGFDSELSGDNAWHNIIGCWWHSCYFGVYHAGGVGITILGGDVVAGAIGTVFTLSAATQSGTVATFTTTVAHGLVAGLGVKIAGVTPSGYNGTWLVASAPTSTTFTAVLTTSGLGAGSVFGTAQAVGVGVQVGVPGVSEGQHVRVMGTKFDGGVGVHLVGALNTISNCDFETNLIGVKIAFVSGHSDSGSQNTINACQFYSNGTNNSTVWIEDANCIGNIVSSSHFYNGSLSEMFIDNGLNTQFIMPGLLLSKFPGGLATKTKAGVPVDGDWGVAPPDGTIVGDTTNGRIYMRVGGVWKFATLT